MDNKTLKYEQRGVSASKDEVHKAIAGMDKGLYPNAFCKILPDFAAGDPEYCNIMHADTAGTKTSLAYLYWRETGDLNVFKGIVQDALVMNTDDMACAGMTGPFMISSTIGRNKRLLGGDVLNALIGGSREFIANMQKNGIEINHAGGETADVGDIVRTLDVGFTLMGRMKRSEVIDINIKPGDCIVGIASFGQSTYEDEYNSGIGSNGLTSARHDVLSKYYAEHFPEAYDTALSSSVAFTGPHKLTDSITLDGTEYQVGKLLLSPTRTYLPYIAALLKESRADIHGMIHCTGGGQTKVMKFVDKLHIVKNNLFPPPPVFHLIKQASGTSDEEMYQVFNMGHRLEIYTKPEHAQKMIELAESYNLEARIIGFTQASDKNRLTLYTASGLINY
jgi:phosphoribosylformylglycinamidine cyclo-ligase